MKQAIGYAVASGGVKAQRMKHLAGQRPLLPEDGTAHQNRAYAQFYSINDD